MLYLFIGAVTFLAAGAGSHFITKWLLQRALQNGWLDEPHSSRKVHQHATPTAGGVGIAGGMAVGLAMLVLAASLAGVSLLLPSWAFWMGAFVMLITGFVDDVKGASFKKKFFIQAAVAYVLLHFGYGVDVNALLPIEIDPYHATLLTVPVTMGWVVGVMNAVNFVDGLDGLAGGVVLIGVAALGISFGLHGEWGMLLTALAVCGALVGFLRHNFYPASIFMGDSGSLLLGYMAAVLPLVAPLNAHPVVNVLIPVVVLGLPILDVITTIMRRLLKRKSIFVPDKDHIHHRLLCNWPEPDAVGGMYFAASWFALAAVIMAVVPPMWSYAVCGATAIVSAAWIVWLGYFDDHVSVRAKFPHVFPASQTPTSRGTAQPMLNDANEPSQPNGAPPPVRPAEISDS
jgi:UDP-GlcNAc:undecaprenyl-phosphate GlcNAc-1-phosphate transferase